LDFKIFLPHLSQQMNFALNCCTHSGSFMTFSHCFHSRFALVILSGSLVHSYDVLLYYHYCCIPISSFCNDPYIRSFLHFHIDPLKFQSSLSFHTWWFILGIKNMRKLAHIFQKTFFLITLFSHSFNIVTWFFRHQFI